MKERRGYDGGDAGGGEGPSRGGKPGGRTLTQSISPTNGGSTAPVMLQRAAAGPTAAAAGAAGEGDDPFGLHLLDEPRVDLPPGLEATIAGELASHDPSGGWERRKRLVALFQSIASPFREALSRRLQHRQPGDDLAGAFAHRLAGPTRSALLATLRGEAVEMPSADLAGLALTVRPEPLVIPPWSEKVAATLDVQAPHGAPVDGPPLRVRAIVRDADGAELHRDESPWPAGSASAASIPFTLASPGPHLLRIEVIEDGILRLTQARELMVEHHGAATGDPTSRQQARESAVAAMSDEQLAGELTAVRAQLATRGADRAAAAGLGVTLPGMAEGAYGGQTTGGRVVSAADDLGREPIDGDHAALADDQAVLELAAHTHGIASPPPAPPADALDLSRLPPFVRLMIPLPEGFHALSPDAAYCRALLERSIADRGLVGARQLVNAIEQAGASDPQLAATAASLRGQLATLEAERDAFLATFRQAGHNATLALLRESEERVGNAFLDYGLTMPSNIGFDEYKATNTAELTLAAGEIADAQRELNTIRDMRIDLQFAWEQRIGSDATAIDTVPQPEQLTTLTQLEAEAERDYFAVRAEHEAKHPVLATLVKGDQLDQGKLDEFAKGVSGPQLAERLLPTLWNIQKARRYAEDGEINYWRQPRILDAARAALGVVPGSMRDRFVAEKVASEAPSWADKYLLEILSVVTSITSFVPGPIGAVSKVATIGLDLTLAKRSIEAFRMQSALAGSDLDRARALAADAPSLVWLALELIAAAPGVAEAIEVGAKVAAAAEAFRRVNAARRAFMEGKGVGNLVERLAHLRTAGESVNLSPESIERLTQEVLEETGEAAADDLVSATGRAGDDLADDAAAGGHVADDAVSAGARDVDGLADDAGGSTVDDAADLAGDDAEDLGGLVDIDDPNKRIAETVARLPAPRRAPPNDARHAELLQLRGSDAPTPSPRPPDWTGNLEAEWRGYPEPPDGHEWYWREGNIELRYKKNAAGGDVPRYHYDGKDFVVFSGEDVKRARYKAKSTWPIYSSSRPASNAWSGAVDGPPRSATSASSPTTWSPSASRRAAVRRRRTRPRWPETSSATNPVA